MAVYDDEDQKAHVKSGNPADDELRRLTGISPDEEGAMDREAHNGAADDIAEHGGSIGKSGRGPSSSSDTLGKGFSGESDGDTSRVQRAKNFFWGSKGRRRTSVGTGIAGVLLGGSFFGLSILSGPAQIVQLSHILQKDSFGSNQSSSNRLSKLFRYARSIKKGDIGETRVGKLGSLTFAKTINQLSDIGIEFQRNPLTGVPESMTVDTAKLSDRFPELKGMSKADAQSFLSNQFDLSPSQFVKIGSGSSVDGLKFAVNSRDFGIGATRALTNNSLSFLDNGKIVTGFKFRALSDFFNSPSLFHPLEKLTASQENKYAIAAGRKAAEEAREKNTRAGTAEAETEATDTLKSKLSRTGAEKLTSSALLLTAGMCLVRSVADDVATFNHAAVEVPAAVEATDKIAVGEQVESGQDFSLVQQGAITEGFTDAQGKDIWQGAALQATEGEAPTGPDMPSSYQQAFSGKTTAANIKSFLGGGEFGTIACSKAGYVVQGLAGLILAISGLLDAGASWGAKAAITAAGAVATSGAMLLIQQQATNLLESKVLVPAVLSGPIGGNLLAYGAREAANIDAYSSGGVALSGSESNSLDNMATASASSQFSSENLFARMFDINNYQSVLGRFAQGFTADPFKNLALITNRLASAVTNLPGNLGLFLPKAYAVQNPYAWPFTHVGLPEILLNDPTLADPYANADTVAKLLDSGSGQHYVDKVMACYGDTVSQGSDGWQVVPTNEIDDKSDAYTSEGCSNFSDTNWRRVTMFVYDSRTMEAVACYAGSDTSACQNVSPGISTASSSGGGQYKVGSFNLKGESHLKAASVQNAADRMQKAAQAIASRGYDIVGLQEMQDTDGQRKDLINDLQSLNSNYAFFPDKSANNSDHSTENTIAYDSSKFSVLGSGFSLGKYFGGNPLKMPWLKLQDKTTQQTFYISNTHDPADASHGQNAKWRAADVTVHLADAQRWSGTPVIYTGDFNWGYNIRQGGPTSDYYYTGDDANKLPYCQITKSGTIADSRDVFQGKTGDCPSVTYKGGKAVINGPDDRIVDHILISNGLQISDWSVVTDPAINSVTDHPGIYTATVVIPGVPTASGGGGASGAISSTADTYGPACHGKGPTYGAVCNGQCVDYVEYMLDKKVGKTRAYVAIGASTAVSILHSSYGFRIDNSPEAGDVVSWPVGGFPSLPHGKADSRTGHVAVVSAVYKDGSIQVMEYNYLNNGAIKVDGNSFDVTTIPAVTANKLTYAHTGITN